MKYTVDFRQFSEAFEDGGRGRQFTYEGLRALWDELTEYEDSTGEELELDVIAFCCDYCEDDPAEIANNYRIDLDGAYPPDVPEYVEEYMRSESGFARLLENGNIIYRSY